MASKPRRPKPANLTGINSDAMWYAFDAVCTERGIGIHVEDWGEAWLLFYAGYEFRSLEVQAAMA